MAQFRRNHERKGLGINMFKVLIFAVLLVLVLVFSYNKIDQLVSGADQSIAFSASEERYYLPSGHDGQVVHHEHYSLGYNEKYEQAAWVAYDLTVEELNARRVPRAKRYNVDYDIKSRSAEHKDYSGSGYTRGHLAPAGDMAFDSLAMRESFYMSNMSPQIRPFNNGIWRELEEQTRDWARKNKKLYIVTGPILDEIDERIGKNRVGVPKAFYKAVLDLEGPEKKAIGFIIPHEKSETHLEQFAVSIDEIEARIGLDFFEELISPDLEEKIESEVNIDDWLFDERRFNRRVNEWNNQ